MFDRLIKLPGNLLRNIVGILPHDENGQQGEPTQNPNKPDYDAWCTRMGGTMDANGLCAIPVNKEQYGTMHAAAFGLHGGDAPITNDNEFAAAYDRYLNGGAPIGKPPQ